MELVASTSYDEALSKLGERTAVGSILRSAEWARVPVDLRQRAFFSATIEDARFLQGMQDFLTDTLANTTETNADGETYFKAGGRAQFIEKFQQQAIRTGLRSTTDPGEIGTLKDIRSESRLGLIFDINLQAAQDYGYWRQGMDSDVLDAFPAQRFIRVHAVRKPRPYHQAALKDGPRLKTDLKYWIALNRDFNVPWGPWGYNSGCDVEDVGRAESDALGLTKPNETIRPALKEFNEHLAASTQGLDPSLTNLLKIAFGDQVIFENDTVRWAGA